MVFRFRAPRYRPRHANLSATFKNGAGYGLGMKGGGSITFDEALGIVERRIAAKEKRLERAAAQRAASHGPTREQLFRVAKAQAAQSVRNAKVKMPVLSIQREEIDA